MKRVSRTTLSLMCICAFLLLATASLGYVMTRQSNKTMRTLIENRMLDVSNTAAAMLDGDALETLGPEDKETPAYQNAYRILSCFEENIELEYIYCVRELQDGYFGFLIDPDKTDPGEFGEHIPYTAALYQASLGKPSVDQVAFSDRWGRFYSAYSPVFNSRHQVAGIVAVDFSADWYENQLRRQLSTILLASIITLGLAGVVIAWISARYRRQIHFMMDEMNTVSEGIETLVHELSPVSGMKLRREEIGAQEDGIEELSDRICALEQQLGEEIAFVRAQAFVDGLTGLGNRLAYERDVVQLDGRIQDGTARFTLIVFDLNGLKEINDRFGHEKGDEAISALGEVLRGVFWDARQYRIGGDEFVVLLEEGETDIPAKLETVDRALGEHGAFTVSKGYAAFQPGEDQAYHHVFKRADAEMYQDKRAYYRTHSDRRKMEH